MKLAAKMPFFDGPALVGTGVVGVATGRSPLDASVQGWRTGGDAGYTVPSMETGLDTEVVSRPTRLLRVAAATAPTSSVPVVPLTSADAMHTRPGGGGEGWSPPRRRRLSPGCASPRRSAPRPPAAPRPCPRRPAPRPAPPPS